MLVIGIAGGSGSGKTTVVNAITQELNAKRVVVIPQDSYYKDSSDLSDEEKRAHNFDHPDAIDWELLCQQLSELKKGRTIQQPVYSFETFLRESVTIETAPAPILLVDGIFSFYFEEIRNLFDLKVYIDADVDVRLSRRILRDMNVRHRPLEYIIDQYFTKVKPMHEVYVEPYKKYADIIIPHNRNDENDFRILGNLVQTFLHEQK